MDDKKKQLNQVIILSILLAFLGFMVFRMFNAVGGSRVTNTADSQATEPTTRVTPMGTVVSTGEVALPEFVEELGLVGALNTNVFKVHDINPSRNPFKRDISWFDEELERIPGKDLPAEFFNEMTDEVPDLNELFNTDKEFVSYRLEKTMAEDDYSFTGSSEDGRITTNIQARTKTEPTIRVEYTEAEGMEVEEVAQPDSATGDRLPSLDNPFGNNPWRQGEAPGSTRAPNGDRDTPFISCYGVSIKGNSRSALLKMPDGSKIVREGDVLMPGNLKIVRITESGVEIRDIRTAEQVMIPLSSPI